MFGLFRRKSQSIEQVAAALDGQTGQSVTTATALECSVVLSCVDIIASGIAVPELNVRRQVGDTGQSQIAKTDPLHRLLNRRPNEWQTSFEFRQMMTITAALEREAVAVPVRDVRNGSVIELLPVLPQWISRRQTGRYDMFYDLADEFGQIGSFRAEDLLIIRNMSVSRVDGLSAVRQARNAIGLAASVERNMTALHDNGGRPSGILSSKEPLSSEMVERLRDAWKKVTSGVGRNRVAILDGGMTFSPVALSSVDAQTLENRRFQIEEICRLFGVYPIMVGHSDKAATYASAEAFFAAHNRRTVLRWQRIWAEKLDEFVLDGAGPLFVEFDNREVQLAPLRDRAEFYARALGSGGGVPFATRNEVRKWEGLDPVADGDVVREPLASTVAPPAADETAQAGEQEQ